MRRVARCGDRTAVFIVAGLLLVSCASLARGQDSGATATPAPPAREIWTGAEAFRNVWSLYTGTTWAPAGAITEDGLRLRFVAGQSSFRYQGQTGPARGVAPFAEAFVGYQGQWGTTTLKAFAGAWGYADILSPADAQDLWGHARVGPKVVFESWSNISPATWASIDASWTSLQGAYWTRARLANRIMPALSAGLELGLSGATGTHAARAGGLLRYEWAAGELAFSAGAASDTGSSIAPAQRSHAMLTPYATVLLLLRF